MALRDLYGRPPRKRPGEAALTRRAMLRIPRTAVGAVDIDYEAATERSRRAFQAEGHEVLLRQLEPVAALLVELAGAEPGGRVLDAGAGDGNVALAAAARGARVDACELSARMAERGRARSEQAGRDVSWSTGDVQQLPYGDDTYDSVLSAFGAALAARPVRTAAELVRVARPGGVVALSAWSPRGLPGGLDQLVEPLGLRPAGVPRPSAWGTEAVLRRRFEGLLEGLAVRTRTVRLSFSSPDEAFLALVRTYGPAAEEQAALLPGFDRLLASCNDRPPRVEIAARYVVAVGRRPAP